MGEMWCRKTVSYQCGLVRRRRVRRVRSGGEGDAQEDGDACRDGGVGDAGCAFVADDADEEDGEGRVEDHLQDGVDGDEDGAVLGVAAGEARPDEHHGDAARHADEDEAVAETRFVGEEAPGEGEHEGGGEEPV